MITDKVLGKDPLNSDVKSVLTAAVRADSVYTFIVPPVLIKVRSPSASISRSASAVEFIACMILFVVASVSLPKLKFPLVSTYNKVPIKLVPSLLTSSLRSPSFVSKAGSPNAPLPYQLTVDPYLVQVTAPPIFSSVRSSFTVTKVVLL